MARVFLIATYESGHQPLNLAWPTALLQQAGHQVVACDASVEAPDAPAFAAALRQADFVGISAPMHTAMRLGVELARRVRRLNSQAHICFYGLYAWLNGDYLLRPTVGSPAIADSVIAGEFEEPLRRLVDALQHGRPAGEVTGVTTRHKSDQVYLARLKLPRPERQALPPLKQYAHYMAHGRAVPAGYVEASRGCLHTCRHCPVTPVYQGRFFVVPAQTVLADVRQQVRAGAQHITFGDPDFLNGPGHALKVTRAMHDAFPQLTFDFTTKVEHILEKRDLLPELKALGASFVVSAFESTTDAILQRLQKGHTLADMDEALAIMRRAGLSLQSTWMPFTPWTTLEDYLHLLQWIRERDLIEHVPAVQLSIRMLVPPRSALLQHEDVDRWLGPLDAASFTYRWRHPDPCMDQLQADVSHLVEAQAGANAYDLFAAIEHLAYKMAGQPQPLWRAPLPAAHPPPRLSEEWFC